MRARLGLAVVATLTVLLLVRIFGDEAGLSDGPLVNVPASGATMASMPGPTGSTRRITWGPASLRNGGSKPLIVTDIELVMGEPGLTVSEGPLYWTDPDRTVGQIVSGLGWPPTDGAWPEHPGLPAPEEGITVLPQDDQDKTRFSVPVQYGLEFDGSDRATIIGIVVTYTVEGREYREFVPSTLAVCNVDPCENEERGWDGKNITDRP